MSENPEIPSRSHRNPYTLHDPTWDPLFQAARLFGLTPGVYSTDRLVAMLSLPRAALKGYLKRQGWRTEIVMEEERLRPGWVMGKSQVETLIEAVILGRIALEELTSFEPEPGHTH